MKKYVIGISSFYHDSSVCLFSDNQLVFACEEEKFTGIKHDNSFPKNALKYVFKKYKLTKDTVEAVCYYEDPQLKLERVKQTIKPIWYKKPLFSLKSYLTIKKNIRDIKRELSKISDNIFYSTHHESHLYYSYYSSPYSDAVCLSVDGVGEIDTVSLGLPIEGGIEYQSLAKYPHSVGLYYSAMTAYLGFKPNEGEYKVMGLASYGDPKKYIDKVRSLITFKKGELKCNMNVFCWDRDDKIMFNEKLIDVLGLEPRMVDEELTQDHKDLAAAVQMRYEEVFFDILKLVKNESISTNLCLGGGCAYNGTANGKVVGKSHIKSLWIPPAPSDAGSAIGACIHYLVKFRKYNNKITKNPFLGPLFFDRDIRQAIGKHKYRKFFFDSKMRRHIAVELQKGKVVGWFQGHCEFGARALGNRSILADPTIDGMKDRINKVIKKREGFRPFAPMVQKEHQDKYFYVKDDVPYMNQVVKVREEYRDILKAVTHVDGTARIQTVYTNSMVHSLLKEFEKLTGYPILLNTSFNIKDKTMVLTPKDAIDTFFDTDMDILVMNNYVLYKNKQ